MSKRWRGMFTNYRKGVLGKEHRFRPCSELKKET